MRPEILFPLYAPITSLKGVGVRVAPLLEKLAGPVVRDVLFLRPHSVIQRTHATVNTAIEGATQIFEVQIDAFKKPRSPQQPWRVETYDGTGVLTWSSLAGSVDSSSRSTRWKRKRLVGGKVSARPELRCPSDSSCLGTGRVASSRRSIQPGRLRPHGPQVCVDSERRPNCPVAGRRRWRERSRLARGWSLHARPRNRPGFWSAAFAAWPDELLLSVGHGPTSRPPPRAGRQARYADFRQDQG